MFVVSEMKEVETLESDVNETVLVRLLDVTDTSISGKLIPGVREEDPVDALMTGNEMLLLRPSKV